MGIRYGVTVFACLVLGFGDGTATAQSDAHDGNALYNAILSPRPDTVPYIFDVTYEELFEGEDSGEEVSLAKSGSFRVDPSQPTGGRVTILKAPEEETPAFERRIANFQTTETIADLFWCSEGAADLAEARGRPIENRPERTVIDETDDRIVFHAAPPEKPVLRREDYDSDQRYKMAKKAVKYLEAETVLSTPAGFVLRRETRLTRAFKPRASFRINTLTDVKDCQISPDGRGSFVQNRRQVISGRALGLLNVNTTTRMRISNLVPLDPAGPDVAKAAVD